jgi:hypothetical protein
LNVPGRPVTDFAVRDTLALEVLRNKGPLRGAPRFLRIFTIAHWFRAA